MDAPRKRVGWQTWVIGCTATVLVLSCCGFGGLLTWGFQRLGKAGGDLNANLVKARTFGLSTTMAEAKHQPTISESDNAAPLLLKAIHAYTKESSKISSSAQAGLRTATSVRRKDTDWKAATDALGQLEPVRQLIAKAVKRPHCDFGPLALEMDKIPSLTGGLADLAVIEISYATQQAEAGHFAEAETAYRELLALGTLINEEQTRMAFTMHLGSQRKVLFSLRRALLVAPNDPVKQEFVQKMIGIVGPTPPLQSAMRQQLAVDLIKARDRTNIGTEKSPIIDMMINAGQGMIAEHYVKTFPLLPKDPEDFAADRTALANFSRRRVRRAGAQTQMNYLVDQACETVATRRMLLSAIALLKSPNEKPEDLLQKEGNNGLDPFDSHVLRYKATSTGFKLYSVGANRIDDGGIPKPPTSADDGPDDVVLEVKRP